MIDPQRWMETLLDRLLDAFGPRLLFLGLQGSYRRGEATEHSDIDVVAVLDSLDIPELEAYHAVIRAMPEAEKACGFLCGLPELEQWPRHELFGLEQDTEAYHGSLSELLPAYGRGDLVESARNAASSLYHQCVHGWLYDNLDDAGVDALIRQAVFLLRTVHFLRTGRYLLRRDKLTAELQGDEQRLLSDRSVSVQNRLTLLLQCCKNILADPDWQPMIHSITDKL